MSQMFSVNSIIVTDSDVQQVENYFGFSFNEGQRKVIKNLTTIDIQACPGSGKTTTLSAKLIILARKFASYNAPGVCIITHTNIAVEEIVNKLGPYAAFYFRYPNHFGTIQSFVDKYLAIPHYKNIYKFSPNIVDSEYYGNVINRNVLLERTGTKRFLEANNIDLGYDLSFNVHDFSVSKGLNNQERFSVPSINKEKMKVHYDRIVSVKLKILEDGYIKYDEAYSMAFRYLKENPLLTNIFQLRFPFVFVDEMQDMETHQANIINKLFHADCIVQKIGDINQSIYSRVSSDNGSKWQPSIDYEHQLIESTRLSKNIAKLVKKLGLVEQPMQGWDNPCAIRPVILVYDDSNIERVKDCFGHIVIKNNLHTVGIAKCIGARKSHSKLFIGSYWKEFNRHTETSEFQNLVSYLEFIKGSVQHRYNTKEIYLGFLKLFCRSLRICKVKSPITGYHFTPASLLRYLHSAQQGANVLALNSQIAEWIASIRDSEDIGQNVTDCIRNLVLSLNGSCNELFEEFAKATVVGDLTDKPSNTVYSYTFNDKQIDLHFDTIHGVKGETHTATLYLETFLRTYDIGGKVLSFLAADDRQKNRYRKDQSYISKLPLAYVAMTRAKHFFALSVHKDRFTGDCEQYFLKNDADWEVVMVDSYGFS